MTATIGIILTGGLSSRMGVDKATMPVGGKPMVVRVADALWEAGLHPVECQGGDAASIEELGLIAEPDAEPGEGPLAAIHTALARHPDRNVVVAACDLVDIDCQTIRALVDAGNADEQSPVIAAAVGGRFHMVSWWRAHTAPKLAALLAEGVDAYQVALDRLAATSFPVEASVVRNVNTPADLATGG